MVMSLAACGSEGGSETKKKEADNGDEKGIELTVSHIMVNETDSQVMAWNKALEEYKETHPNVTGSRFSAGCILFLGRRIFPVFCKGRDCGEP